jgi:DNA-binding beta-propeller fold protein YncE
MNTMKYMSRLIVTIIFFGLTAIGFAQKSSGYKLSKTFKIASGGGWDYIAVYDHKLFVSHATQVNILDASNGDSLGYIPGTTGVHGIAFIPALGKGYVSCGRLNSITVFDLKTYAILKQIPVGQNPDAIMYEPFSKKIITCNGRSNNLSIVDPQSDTVVSTIALSGKPETAVSDEIGKIFVNIEDKNSISAVDLTAGKVLDTWNLAPAEGPTGLAIDLKTKKLFAGCDKQLLVVDYTNGDIINRLPIGDGCDGVAFDETYKYVFASCGAGILSVAEEDARGRCKIIDNIKTKKSARTITNDPTTHEVFLPAAEFGKEIAGQRPPVIPGTFQILVFSK